MKEDNYDMEVVQGATNRIIYSLSALSSNQVKRLLAGEELIWINTLDYVNGQIAVKVKILKGEE